MKKIISFVAAATMILSLCAPVLAAENAVPSVYTTETFDSGEINVVSGNVMRLSPGVGDRGYALRCTGNTEFSAGDGVFDIGQTFLVSAWIRSKNEANKTVTFSLCGLNTDGAYASFNMVYSGEITNEWTQATASGVWEGTFSDGTKWDSSVPLTLKINMGENAVYDLDDLRLVPIFPESGAGEEDLLVGGDFENGKEGWSGTVITDGTAPQGESYLNIAGTKNTWMQFSKNITLKANHLYKFSYWVKCDEAYDNNGKPKDTFGIWFLQSARTRVVDTNSFNTDLPGYVQNGFPVNGEWQKVEYYYQFEYKTFTNKEFQMIFRLYPEGMQSVESTGSFGIDDFKIIDMGEIANGSFESDDTEIVKFLNETGEANKGKTAITEQSVLAWNEKDAETDINSDVRPDASGKKSMKVTVSADGGYAYQGVSLDRVDANYKISFWVKGVGLSEEKPFALVLDRSVPKSGGDQESYIVPDKTYVTGFREQNTNGDFGTWSLTNEWQYFSCIVPNSFPLKEGLNAANADTIPRLPFMYFDVDGNKAGTTYLLDDIEIAEYEGEETEDSGYRYPYLTRVAFAGNIYETGVMQARYTFGSLCGATDGGSQLRMYEITDNGEILVATALGKSITIPEGLGGKKIRIEAVPVDTNGRMGKNQSAIYTVGYAKETTAEISEWNALGDITASVSIISRGTSAKAEPVIVVLATYDEQNKMVSYETKKVSLSESGNLSETITFRTSEHAKTAKLYTWSGNELSTAGAMVYHDTVSYTKGE